MYWHGGSAHGQNLLETAPSKSDLHSYERISKSDSSSTYWVAFKQFCSTWINYKTWWNITEYSWIFLWHGKLCLRLNIIFPSHVQNLLESIPSAPSKSVLHYVSQIVTKVSKLGGSGVAKKQGHGNDFTPTPSSAPSGKLVGEWAALPTATQHHKRTLRTHWGLSVTLRLHLRESVERSC